MKIKSLFLQVLLILIIFSEFSGTSLKFTIARAEDPLCAGVPAEKRRDSNHQALVPLEMLQKIGPGCVEGAGNFAHSVWQSILEVGKVVAPRTQMEALVSGAAPLGVGPALVAVKHMAPDIMRAGMNTVKYAQDLASGKAKLPDFKPDQTPAILQSVYNSADEYQHRVLQCYNLENQARVFCHGGSEAASFLLPVVGERMMAARGARIAALALDEAETARLGLAEGIFAREAAAVAATASFPEDAAGVASVVGAVNRAAGGRKVITFIGYSGRGYKDEEAARALLTKIAGHLKPNEAIINIGVTKDGIGMGYPIFQQAGFDTIGIARAEGATVAEGCDMAALINTESWGGVEGGKLTAVSKALTSVTDEAWVLGGGDIGAQEAVTAALQGKTIRVFEFADGKKGEASLTYAALKDLVEGNAGNPNVEKAMQAFGGSRPKNLSVLFCSGAEIANCARTPPPSTLAEAPVKVPHAPASTPAVHTATPAAVRIAEPEAVQAEAIETVEKPVFEAPAETKLPEGPIYEEP